MKVEGRARFLLIGHRGASFVALALIVLFWTSTVASELAGELFWIRAVKTMTLCAIPLLVAAVVAARITGTKLAPNAQGVLLENKRRRLQVVAANGVLVLAPSAVTLWWLVSTSGLSGPFHLIQTVELLAGALNIALLALNARDGLALSGRMGKPPSARSSPSVSQLSKPSERR